MYKLLILPALVGLLMFSSTVNAADPAIEIIKKSMQRELPGLPEPKVTKTTIPGLYEVLMGQHVFYVSADGRYLMQGDLYDLNTRQNLTEAKRSQFRLKALAGIKQSEMIHFPAARPKHTITVFTDIDCVYCRRLHAEIADINALGISVNYLFFPRAGVGSPSYYKAVKVWCAKDRNKALTEAKVTGDIQGQTCVNNPVLKHMQIAKQMGINSTPTIILEDGRIVRGYAPAKALLQEIVSPGR
jgi:thiol:disulfide interchange protein DsbC